MREVSYNQIVWWSWNQILMLLKVRTRYRLCDQKGHRYPTDWWECLLPELRCQHTHIFWFRKHTNLNINSSEQAWESLCPFSAVLPCGDSQEMATYEQEGGSSPDTKYSRDLILDNKYTSVVYKPSILWYSIVAAQTD